MAWKEIKLENNNGGIRLKFQVNGKRYSLSPVRGGTYGVEWDMRRGKAIAETIQTDIETGHFDPTLEKYRAQSSESIKRGLAKATRDLEEIEKARKAKPGLRELWSKYRDYKAPSLAPSTLAIDFDRRVGNCLKDLPTNDLENFVAIRDWLMANKPATQAKKILTQLSACCDWAVDSQLLAVNPFLGMTKKIRTPKKSDEDDINPFTADERDRLIKAFQTSRFYAHYANLVRFLFFIGCRPNEAVALNWSDWRGEKLTFNKGFVEGTAKKGLKSQKTRTIRINDQAREILADQKAKGLESPLIFPSPDGNHIDWHNFSNRAWREILEGFPDIEYRNPYQTRHTFITLAIRAGVSYPDLGKHCGNSPEIILRRYQGISRGFVMPQI